DYSFPEGFDEQAKDLVQRLLVRPLPLHRFDPFNSILAWSMQVRDPTQRLGAGPSTSDHGMPALRVHPFFAIVEWATLWKDSAPPLEAGLVKRILRPDAANTLKDVGAEWDKLVDDNDGEDDGIEWAEDADPDRSAIFIRTDTHRVLQGGNKGDLPN